MKLAFEFFLLAPADGNIHAVGQMNFFAGSGSNMRKVQNKAVMGHSKVTGWELGQYILQCRPESKFLIHGVKNSVMIKYLQIINRIHGNYIGHTIHLKYETVCLDLLNGRIQRPIQLNLIDGFC